jgi:hypothetical protein
MPKQTKKDNTSYSINEGEFKIALKKIIQAPPSKKVLKKKIKPAKKRGH